MTVGSTRTFHFEIELSAMEMSSWRMCGLPNRSMIVSAYARRSASGSGTNGTISSNITRARNVATTGSSVIAFTVSSPALNAASEVAVCAPFRMRTLRVR